MPTNFAACSLRLEAAEQQGLFIVKAAIALDMCPTEHIGPLVADRAAVERIVEAFLDKVFVPH